MIKSDNDKQIYAYVWHIMYVLIMYRMICTGYLVFSLTYKITTARWID